MCLPATDRKKYLKCVVWDLDETVWEGVLLEGGGQVLRPGVLDTIRKLDSMGMLQSVASKNDHDIAWPVLQKFELAEYFLLPRICWSGKGESIREIAEGLGIGLDAVAFIDDQAIERDEVVFCAPQVTVFAAEEAASLADDPRFQSGPITDDGRIRRLMYQADIQRNHAEKNFAGARDEFLSTLDMRLGIHRATAADLARAEELTLRTNQLNTTGITYSQAELEQLSQSPDHLVLVAKLSDRYGSSGTVGLVVIERTDALWTIRLLIMSCRVVSRGIGSCLLSCITHSAAALDVRLRAAFIHTDRNRQMYVSYKFAGFRECDEQAQEGLVMLEHDFMRLPSQPAYISVTADLGAKGVACPHASGDPGG